MTHRTAAALCIAITGCAPVEPAQLGDTAQEGRFFNGRFFNGRFFNGTSLTGDALQGIKLHGTSLPGHTFSALAIDGGELVGTDTSGAVLGAGDFAGAVLDGFDASGAGVELVVRGYDVDPYTGVPMYQVEGLDADGVWQPLCGLDEKGNPVDKNLAYLVPGLWDMQHIGQPGGGSKIAGSAAQFATVACLNQGAVAKCVQLGYQPWLSADHDKAHQSCVRMVRADYCGDGVSWTKDGTEIDIEDELPEQLFAMFGADPHWEFEALWGPEGARCIESYRYSDVHPDLGVSLEGAVRAGKCPNMPRPVSGDLADEFLRTFKTGTRAGKNLCGWVSPSASPPKKKCDPRRDKRCRPAADFGGYCTVNAKLPGTW